MKANPNKIITIFARFSGATAEIHKDIEDVSVRLYKGDQHIKDLEYQELGSPMSWKASHLFPRDAPIGDDYKAIFEIKIKDQKDPIIEEQKIELVRDINFTSHIEMKDAPMTIKDNTFQEIPSDILAYLENKHE